MAQYEIIIRQGKSVGSDDKDTNVAGKSKKDKEDKNNSKIAEKEQEVLKYALIQSSRQLIVGKVGEVARDSLLQQQIDGVVGLAETAVSFAINPAYGAINLAINITSKTIDYLTTISKQQSANSVNWLRAGWINGSRD